MLDFFYAKKAYSFCLLHTIPVSPFSFFHSTVNWIEDPIQKVKNVLWKNTVFYILESLYLNKFGKKFRLYEMLTCLARFYSDLGLFESKRVIGIERADSLLK